MFVHSKRVTAWVVAGCSVWFGIAGAQMAHGLADYLLGLLFGAIITTFVVLAYSKP